jgi:branched-chain amino acid aminotransferase
MNSLIWHNGHFKHESEAVFRASDRLRLGDGVFDTMLAVDGDLIYSHKHFKRLIAHASVLHIRVERAIAQLEHAAQEVLRRNDFMRGHYAINTIITCGPATRGPKSMTTGDTQIVIMASHLADAAPPIHAIVAQNIKRNENSVLSSVKSVNYGDMILAQIEAGEKDASEAVLLNTKGHVACFTSGNVFIVQGGKLYTPPLSDGAMDGIIRDKLIRKAGAAEKSFMTGDLQTAEGVYITNSIRGIRPVLTLDGKTLPTPTLTFPTDFHYA